MSRWISKLSEIRVYHEEKVQKHIRNSPIMQAVNEILDKAEKQENQHIIDRPIHE